MPFSTPLLCICKVLILSSPSAYAILILNSTQRNGAMCPAELREGMAQHKFSAATAASSGTWNPTGICME